MQLYLFPSESPNELEVLTKSPFVLIESEGHSSTILIIKAVSPLLSENHSALQTTQLSGAISVMDMYNQVEVSVLSCK